jgi:hypothetical protein
MPGYVCALLQPASYGYMSVEKSRNKGNKTIALNPIKVKLCRFGRQDLAEGCLKSPMRQIERRLSDHSILLKAIIIHSIPRRICAFLDFSSCTPPHPCHCRFLREMNSEVRASYPTSVSWSPRQIRGRVRLNYQSTENHAISVENPSRNGHDTPDPSFRFS